MWQSKIVQGAFVSEFAKNEPNADWDMAQKFLYVQNKKICLRSNKIDFFIVSQVGTSDCKYNDQCLFVTNHSHF